MCYIILPTVLWISKYMWYVFYLLFKIFIPFIFWYDIKTAYQLAVVAVPVVAHLL